MEGRPPQPDMGSVENSWATALNVTQKDVTAVLSSTRRALLVESMDVYIMARLNEGISGESQKQGIIDKSLVAQSINNSPVLKEALGLPNIETVTVQTISSAVLIWKLPTLTDLPTSPAPAPGEITGGPGNDIPGGPAQPSPSPVVPLM